MATPVSPAPLPLARRAREQFVGLLEGGLPSLSEAIRMRLLESGEGGARERQDRLEGAMAFEQARAAWMEGVRQAWRRALAPPTATSPLRLDLSNLQLMGDEVVENKILASRLSMAMHEKVAWELNDLKQRIQHLEKSDDLASEDILRPEAIALLLVEQWVAAKLTRESWLLVKDVIQAQLAQRSLEAYQRTNEFLVDAGVLPEIPLRARVKRPPPGAGAASGPGALAARHAPQEGSASSYRSAVADETRMMTSGTPLARARQRASGVLGQLKRLLSDKLGDAHTPAEPSPGLREAIGRHATQVQTQIETRVTAAQGMGDSGSRLDAAAVRLLAEDLRQRTSDLKKRAETPSEKATIEIVALMFQSILSEERIPAAIRVWFARLQMPVLRLAIAEPEFFSSLEHPARQLIDRMGSCVLGFDAAAISGSAMEGEIKRVVQVIEQYPETGRRVFQLVFDEFQQFLSKFLTESGPAQRLVSVAQQVEQKETMVIQYTIELRKMLGDMPVRDEIREFLFKIWAEVLAVAAVKNGAQHEETLALKKCASELVWAASAKPNRSERAKVINELPGLLQRLRRGMSLLGLPGGEQEAHIKVISDTLADAFQSKTEAIPQARIEEMTRRLANLEDFIADDAATDLPLDKESIELMLGIDASTIEVISAGGSQPTAGMMAWAQELQPGTWFTLDHNGKVCHVQYAWRSDRRQLHLFASADGRSYLVQLTRLASYLQAGLLVPTEEEALTVRATRDALAKLDANPERLLQ